MTLLMVSGYSLCRLFLFRFSRSPFFECASLAIVGPMLTNPLSAGPERVAEISVFAVSAGTAVY
jgi:hypothetical protein